MGDMKINILRSFDLWGSESTSCDGDFEAQGFIRNVDIVHGSIRKSDVCMLFNCRGSDSNF
jgi:hypothetical protein